MDFVKFLKDCRTTQAEIDNRFDNIVVSLLSKQNQDFFVKAKSVSSDMYHNIRTFALSVVASSYLDSTQDIYTFCDLINYIHDHFFGICDEDFIELEKVKQFTINSLEDGMIKEIAINFDDLISVVDSREVLGCTITYTSDNTIYVDGSDVLNLTVVKLWIVGRLIKYGYTVNKEDIEDGIFRLSK